MPSKYPVLKPEQFIAAIRKMGYSFVSQKGSHRKYSDGAHVVIIPMHNEIAKGTLRDIIIAMGITIEQLQQFL